jgi:hypothetical protein
MNVAVSLRVSIFLLIGLIVFITSCSQQKAYDRKGRVHIEKNGDTFSIIRDGKPFLIKGVAGFTHLETLEACGGNTIRTWDTTNLQAILDSAHAHNLAVMVGLPLYNSNHIRNYYNDPVQMKILYDRFERVVERSKDHPALLMWCLGNEMNYFYKPEDDFFDAYNTLLTMIHEKDPDHPVTTALLNFGKKSIYNVQEKIPTLDVISFNTYGRLSKLKDDLASFSWYWDGPFILGEWGINGYWESDSTAWGAPIEDTSTKKAEQYKMIYESRMPFENPRYLGAFVFYWGYQHEKTPTWYSLFSDDGAASEAVETLSGIWGGKPFHYHAPKVEYTLLDGKGARQNIILTASTEHQAEVIFKAHSDSVRLRWQILPEDWYKEKEDDSNKNKTAPAALPSLIGKSDGNKISFHAPMQEGPYRIFVWAYDQHGNFATSNTPFYVVEQ